MSKTNSACLKISRNGKVLEVKVFTFAKDRQSWLLLNGFLPDGPDDNIFRHMDGRVAGKFNTDEAQKLLRTRRWDDVPGFHSCDKQIQHQSMWNSLIGVK